MGGGLIHETKLAMQELQAENGRGDFAGHYGALNMHLLMILVIC